MANYKDIKGFHVQSLSSDPLATQTAGGAWASGGALNTARPGQNDRGVTGAAQTASLATGGSPYVVANEEYNGTAWTEKNDLNTGRGAGGGGGTSTSSLYFGGLANPNVTTDKNESWNGTSWTESPGDLNTARRFLGSTAISNSNALAFGGYTTTYLNVVESWNGSSWTEVAEINSAKGYMGGAGPSTAAISIGGEPTPRAEVETWNGTSWTATTEINTARSQGSCAGLTNTNTLFFGGEPPATGATEYWDGSSWTELADLSTARSGLGGAGTTEAGLAYGAGPPGKLTEEWSAPADYSQINEGQTYFNSSSTNAFKVTQYDVPGATWASVATLNTSRNALQSTGGGTSTEGIVFGGLEPSLSQKTEEWDGSSWTEKNDLNNGMRSGGGTGASNSAMSVGGDSSPVTDNAETWNGTSWTNITEMGQAREGLGAAGATNTAVIIFAGGPSSDAQTWNGSAWTEVSDVNNPRTFVTGTGIQTSALCYGGSEPAQTGKTESWDGSTWTEVNDLNTARAEAGGSGTSNSIALCFGGYAPAPSKKAVTEVWNGTSWTEINDLGTARSSGGSLGNSGSAALYAGGTTAPGAPGVTGIAEQFTSSLSNKTITLG